MGGVSVVERIGTVPTNNETVYVMGNHLGSASMTFETDGDLVANARYLPFGEERWEEVDMPTDRGYTNQRNEKGFGLMDYNARFYSPYLNRWIQPDNIIPDPYNALDWDRYSYVRNNPINLVDPSGNIPCIDYGDHGECVVDPIWYQERGLSEQAAQLKYGWDMLRSSDGYWNDYGRLPFSNVDFLGLFSYWEVASYSDGSRDIDILEGSTRRLYMKANCKGKCTANQIFTFLANNGGDHQTSRVNGMLKYGELVAPSIRNGTIYTMMDEARLWGLKMINAIGSPWSFPDNNRPSDWGNPRSPTYDAVVRAIDAAGGTSPQRTAFNGIYFKGVDFMILTANQVSYWMNYCSSNKCPSPTP